MIQQTQLMAAAFADPNTAKRCLDQLKQMERDGTINLVDGAVMVKQSDGKLKIDELEELTPKKGRRRGAIIGGIFGAIFPPALLASAVVGAIGGGALGRFTDQGIENDDLKAIGEELEPGHSAIIAIVEDKWLEQFTSAISGYDRLTKIAIDSETAADLIQAADSETGESAGALGVQAQDPALSGDATSAG